LAAAAKSFYKFLTTLNPDLDLESGISVINPYHQSEVKKVLKQFCDTYYGENKTRILILGINPGRFGAGVTGIPFTDPVELEQKCGIANSFQKKQELSSRFIYEMITAFGGAEKFYNRFLLSAVCPLGFLQGTTNYNYYDSTALLKKSGDFIRMSLQEQASWNISKSVVISLGKKNASCLEAFNNELKIFEKVITFEHPRYIMQYKLKSKSKFIESYCDVLNQF